MSASAYPGEQAPGSVPQRTPPVTPMPSQNQVDAVGQRTAKEIAASVVKAHRAGLMARMQRDLLSEKLLLHIDGSGDFQWADILHGQRVTIPRAISEYRKTENVLRLIVDNAVAHHTTMPLRFFSDSLPDRRSRDKSTVNNIWANALADQQDMNGLFADALYMAMPAGFCPVHAYWRDGVVDSNEGSGAGASGVPGPGFIDCWLGNPFDTVFDRASKRGSINWMSYGRMLPADLVRMAFSHVPGIAGLEGTTKIPSASIFQRIARLWKTEGLGVHGTAVEPYRRSVDPDTPDELMAVLCREILPGVSPDYPMGRLQVVAVPGTVDFRRVEGQLGSGILLADQPLPGGDFSASIFYSHHRGDDIHGKPWVEDIDLLQVDLNILLSKYWEVINRMIESPIVAPGGAIDTDMADIGGYNLMEVEASVANWRPEVMRWPPEILTALQREIEDKRSAIYTGGGYQAASRGEAPGSRIAYRAIVALQQADNSVHGPVNQRFRRSACDFMQKCWKQMKAFGDVPWLIESGGLGDEYGYLAQPYVDSAKLSSRPPTYKLINAFGPSPEIRAQEILELVAVRGADGKPFMTTAEARRAYPNQQMFDDSSDPKAVQRRRARTIATQFKDRAVTYCEQRGMTVTAVTDPGVVQAAYQLFAFMESRYPRLRDDDLNAHLEALSEITQDESANPIARLAAMQRQNLYFEWQKNMASQMAPAPQTSISIKGAPLDPVQTKALLGGEGVTLPDQIPVGPVQPGSPPAVPGAPRSAVQPSQPQALPPGPTPRPAPVLDRRGIARQVHSGGAVGGETEPTGVPALAATARG